MKSLRAHAIVLRRTNYGEADRIVKLLTTSGTISAIAKGVRREKSRLAGGIELLAVSDVVVVKGRGELGVLTSARLIDFYGKILEDYSRMEFAYEVLKQINKLSDAVEDEELFAILRTILELLNQKDIQLELIEAWFYLKYSELTGHSLNLSQDVDGNDLSQSEIYQYDISEKGLRRSRKGDIRSSHIKLLRLISVKPVKVLLQIGGLEDVLPICLLTARQHAAI